MNEWQNNSGRCIAGVRTVLLCGCMGLVILFTGCNPVARKDGRERNNRLVSRAYTLLDAGEYREAARLLREALDAYPTMARPHLDLALILHDQQRDFVRAIYHYQRYLELRPGTEKDGMIEQRIMQARDALIASYGVQAADPEGARVPVEASAVSSVTKEQEPAASSQAVASTVAMQNQLAQLREERDGFRIALAEQERVLQTKQQQIVRLEGRVRVLERQVDTATSLPSVLAGSRDRIAVRSPNGASVDPSVSGEEIETLAAIPRTYEVRANDSLSVIAHRVYGDATKWRLIQDANREVLGNSEMLRIGQVLVIPEL